MGSTGVQSEDKGRVQHGLFFMLKYEQMLKDVTEYQRCLVHQVRNTLKYVPDKDRKAFAKDLKTIYNAPSEEDGRKALDRVKSAREKNILEP